MGDHTQQRIHPVDVEAPAATAATPTAPLVPGGIRKSENGDPAVQQQYYPTQQRTIPVTHSRPPKRRRNCCYRCFCWTLLAFVLLVVAVGATVGILYWVFDPKIPKYSVDRLRVSNFSVDSNLTVHASFDMTVTTRNPNKRIGIYYKSGSYLEASYDGNTLGSGTFPVFYQGHKNTTTLTVTLNGVQQLNSGVVAALQRQQQTGTVPLDFRGDVPVRVKLGKLKLWKVKLGVRCKLEVDSLRANNQISLRNSHCKFKLRKLFA